MSPFYREQWLCPSLLTTSRKVVRYLGCHSCGVMESSAVSFCLRVILVFRDIIYVIVILYLWHLVNLWTLFVRMCRTIDPGSYIRWVLGFGIKTRYDGGWTCRCMMPFGTYFWCMVMNYLWWIMVAYMFSFWYWLLMGNGCLSICLAFGTDFWWMMVVNMFIFCLYFDGSQ
jgi:hypothetical protein